MPRSPAQLPPPQVDVVLCIAVHRFLRGVLVDEVFDAAGFSRADIIRSLHVARSDADQLEAEARRMAAILVGLRAPGVTVDRVELVMRLTDETQEQRLDRAAAAGWFDAVVHRLPRSFDREPDRAAYDQGRASFLAIMAEADARERMAAA